MEQKQLTDQQEQEVFDQYENSVEQQSQRQPFQKRPFFKPGQKPAAGGGVPEEFIRVRLPNPRNREVLGIVAEDFGQKLLVKCIDGFTRVCRIPGKIRYKVYINPGDVVLVQKWTVQTNEKGDYLYRYTRTQVSQLVKKGFLKQEDLG